MRWDVADFARLHVTGFRLEPWQEQLLRQLYGQRPQPADVVHVITTLGPSDEPGLVVHAEFLTTHEWSR